MKILTIDGGGIRGIFPAYILMKIEEETQRKISELFDMVVGTSTGSIVAAAVACEMPMVDIVNLYQEKGEELFEKKRFSLWGLLKPQYKNESLEKEIHEKFGDAKFKDIEKIKLLIPASDLGNACVHVFKSNYDRTFTRDPNRLLYKAIMASCAAPGYFPAYKVDDYLLADGGLWANNPALIGYVEAITRLNQTAQNLRIVSLGCGTNKQYYSTNTKKWGLLNGYKKLKLIDYVFALQSSSVEGTMKLLMANQNYLRINIERQEKLSLDSIDIIDNLKTWADKEFTYRYQEIKQLLQLP